MRHPDVIESLQIKEEMLAEKDAKIEQLRTALKDIVNLMVSMQSLGYFTNPEWETRLLAAQLALASEKKSKEQPK